MGLVRGRIVVCVRRKCTLDTCGSMADVYRALWRRLTGLFCQCACIVITHPKEPYVHGSFANMYRALLRIRSGPFANICWVCIYYMHCNCTPNTMAFLLICIGLCVYIQSLLWRRIGLLCRLIAVRMHSRCTPNTCGSFAGLYGLFLRYV